MPQPRASRKDDTISDLALSTSYHAEMSRRSVVKGLFALAAASVLFGSPVRALAADATKETKEALASAQAEYDEANKQLDELSLQFQDLSIEQDKTIGQIEDVQEQIDDAQAEIDEQQDELEERQEVLSERVVSSYKTGGNDALALLLSAESFDEMLSNSYYLNKVNERDRRVIEEVVAIQRRLEREKSALEGQKAELEELKSEQTAQLKQMKAKKDEVQKLLDGLSTEVQELMNKRDQEILAAAAAEEAARQAAAAAQQGGWGVTGNAAQVAPGASAQQRVVSACHSTPSPGYGLCAAWVCYVFENAGIGTVGGNADDMYSAWCVSSNKDNLRVGMIIAVSSHPHTQAGRIYGHVGIYVGNNTVMDNVGYVRSINLDQWISYYGGTVTPRWGWANGVNLEG